MSASGEITARGRQRKTLYVWSETKLPPEEKRQIIVDWMVANGIEAKTIALQPITLEFVPGCAGSLTSCNGISTGPWWIAFSQRYTDANGNYEPNALSGGFAEVLRTIPMTIEPPLDLVPEWAGERGNTFLEEEPPVRVARLSEVQAVMDEEGEGP